jgi:hypothetical protein
MNNIQMDKMDDIPLKDGEIPLDDDKKIKEGDDEIGLTNAVDALLLLLRQVALRANLGSWRWLYMLILLVDGTCPVALCEV